VDNNDRQSGQRTRQSLSFVDHTIDLPWRNFLKPEFGTKFLREVLLYLDIPEFLDNREYDRSKEAFVPKSSSITPSVWWNILWQTRTDTGPYLVSLTQCSDAEKLLTCIINTARCQYSLKNTRPIELSETLNAISGNVSHIFDYQPTGISFKILIDKVSIAEM